MTLLELGVFALLYQLHGGLKAAGMTDIVGATLLVMGGLIIAFQGGVIAGFSRLVRVAP